VKALDIEGFRRFLKREGKSQRVIDATVAHAVELERYLKEQRDGTELANAHPEDLDAFIAWIEKDEELAAKKYMLGIRYLYEFIPNDEIAYLASYRWNERVARSAAPLKLKEFPGVSAANLAKLGSVGIRNVNEMVASGQTPAKRRELSARTGVSVAVILELVKLSDLSRIQGVKGVRARLYFDAAVDTTEKLSAWNPEDLRTYLVEFVKRTGFRGIAPLPKEVKFTVEVARRLPKIAEY
jgi:hypothetical protein